MVPPRKAQVPVFFRRPSPNDAGTAHDFIRVKDTTTDPLEWEKVMCRRPYILAMGDIEIAVRSDKQTDPAVMIEAWRLALAVPAKGRPRMVAKSRWMLAEYWAPKSTEMAVMFGRGAEAAHSTRKGAQLLEQLEARLATERGTSH